MAKIMQVPKHVSATFSMDDVYALIVYLDSTKVEFIMDEQVEAILDGFKGAYDGDLPGNANNAIEDGTVTP
jgi:hypothetical protein